MVWTLFLALLLMSSCGGSGSKSKVTHVPVQVKTDGNWSLMNIETGAILFEGEFKTQPSIVTDNVFTTRNKETNELFYNKIEDEKTFKQIAGPFKSGNLMNNGIAIVCKEESYLSGINASGEEIFVLKPADGVAFSKVGQCFDGMIMFQAENKFFGFLDKTGKIAIKAQFDYVDDFHDGLARATMHTDSKDKFVIINKSGEIVSEIDKGFVGPINNNSMAYSDLKKEFGIIKTNKEQEKLISASSKFEKISILGDDIFYSSDGDWGLINESGEIIIRAKYHSLSRLSEEMLLGIKKDGKDVEYELLNSKGEVIKKDDIDGVKYGAFNLRNGFIMLKDGKDFQLMNAKGELVGTNTVKEWAGNDEIIALECNSSLSQLVESDYFDWSKLKEYIGSIKAGSLASFSLGVNCIQANELLTKFASNSNIGEKGQNNDQGKGLVFAYEVKTNNAGFSIFIGNGYNEKSTSTDNESEQEADNSTDSYPPPKDSTAAASPEVEPQTAAEAYENNGVTPSEVPIKDDAPEWYTYQTSLSNSVDLGKSGTISISLTFDEYIKKAITKSVIVDYGYTTGMEEKIIGYARNSAAKLTSITMSFSVNDEKSKKLKSMIQEAFGSGFRVNGESYGTKKYLDSKGNYWELNGTSIKLVGLNNVGSTSSIYQQGE